MAQKTLRELFLEHRGKVSVKWDRYLSEYQRLLSAHRERPVNLLEIGVQNGGSLELWARYFPNAERLIGCDIDPACGRLRYDDPRIAVVVGDATTDASERQILALAGHLDLIIDDGSHHSGDLIRSFARYFPHLADGGLYVAEDLHASYWPEYQGGLHEPSSSVSFFKQLADVINHEHWRSDQPAGDVLARFCSGHGAALAASDLASIHSVEFVNSLCIVGKRPPAHNLLGPKMVAGTEELVSADAWSSQAAALRLPPPSEALTARDHEVACLLRALAARDEELAALRASTCWRLTAPLRWLRARLSRPTST